MIRENVFFFVDANVPHLPSFLHILSLCNSFVGSITGFVDSFLFYIIFILGLACICSMLVLTHESIDGPPIELLFIIFTIIWLCVLKGKSSSVSWFDHYITALFGCYSPWFMFDVRCSYAIELHLKLKFINLYDT